MTDITDFSSRITSEPVGFIVYIEKDDIPLSLASFCNESGKQILDIMRILTASSGFKPEPADAIGFFLFEENAKNFAMILLESY